MASLRLLLVLLLVALAAPGLAKHRRKSKWETSKACGSLDCPEFRLEKDYKEYDIRTYRSARWVVTEETESQSYEIAFLKATQRLREYFNGKNHEGERLDHTRPTIAGVRPNEDGATLSRNFTFAFYLPDRYQGRRGHKAPIPLDPSLRIEKWDRDTLFVRSFGGFATEATILNEMRGLTEVLEDDDRDYEEDTAWVAVYDPAYRLTMRFNEIALEVTPKKKRHSGKKGRPCAEE